jgi:hypothetical protein
MKIEIKKFGSMLISRPEGRDAALVLKNQILPQNTSKKIELDFSGVVICSPSWLDEMFSELVPVFGKENIYCVNTTNSSVKASLEIVLEGYP